MHFPSIISTFEHFKLFLLTVLIIFPWELISESTLIRFATNNVEYISVVCEFGNSDNVDWGTEVWIIKVVSEFGIDEVFILEMIGVTDNKVDCNIGANVEEGTSSKIVDGIDIKFEEEINSGESEDINKLVEEDNGNSLKVVDEIIKVEDKINVEGGVSVNDVVYKKLEGVINVVIV